MTDDSKQKLLKYMTGNLSQEQGTNEPQFDDIQEKTTTYIYEIEETIETKFDYDDVYVSKTGILNAIADQNENGKRIVYGEYSLINSDIWGDYQGFIAILNNNFELEQVITEFNSGTKIRVIQDLHYDEDGNLYGIDGSLYNENEQFRFIMLNNLAVKNPATDSYEAVLRQSYYIPSVRPTICKKVPNEATYVMIYDEFVENGAYNYIGAITLKINVGSENEWKDYKSDLHINTIYINNIDQIIIDKNENDINFKILLGIYIDDASGNHFSNIYEFYNNEEVLSYNLIKTGVTIGSNSGFYEPISTIYISTNDMYYKIPTEYYSDTKLEKISVFHRKDNIETEVFSFISASFAYMFFNKDTNGINYVYENTNEGIIYIGRIIDNKHYQKSKQGHLYGDDTFFIVEHNFNLYNYIVDSYDDLYTMQEIYNSDNYNGLPYESETSLKPKSGRLLGSDNNVIFDRNLYNLSINQNTTTSTIEIPNTLLNDIEISTEQLISENNNVITSNQNSYTKNIYEQLLINYINTLIISDCNNSNNVKTNTNASVRLNKSISELCDYDDAKMTKYKVYYKNQISDIYWNGDSDIYWNQDTSNYWYQTPQILDLPTPTLNNKKYTYQLEINTYSGIEKIEFISNDEQTIYLTLDLSSLENDKKYILKQDVYIKE